MYYLTSDEIKKELLSMLQQLTNFFDANNLSYSITSGTLLGAVRHNGFIPWDDDIDISMLRSEYDKLISILKKDNNINNALSGCGFELENSYLPFIKIINPKIETEETVIDDIVDKGHLWIDIFPMDGVPNHFSKFYNKYIFGFWRTIYNTKRVSVEFPKMLNNTSSKKLKILNKINYKTITKQYINNCARFNVNKCNKLSDYTWGNTVIPKDMMQNLKKYKFENLECLGIADSHEYLTKLYGNYMELPPENKRVNHGLKAWYSDQAGANK